MTPGNTELPLGWGKAALGDIVVRMSNGANVQQYDEKVGLPISRIETIWDGRIDLDRVKYIQESDDNFVSKYRLLSGDILFSHINSDSHLGKTAIFKGQIECLIHGINLLLIRPSPEINSDFLNYQFQLLKYKGAFIDVAQRAVNQSSINQKKLKTFELTIPPFREQSRIVSKIEELYTELDSGIDSLKTARELLNVYRYALLQSAFEGKLTARWREENKINLRDANRLIERIKEDRNAHYQARLAQWTIAPSEYGSKPRAPKMYAPFARQALDDLPKLPDGWIWEKLGWMTCGVEYGTAAKSAKSGAVPVLRMGNIQNARFDWSDLAYTSDEEEIRKYSLRDGDVLFNRTNSPALVGKTAIYRGERLALFAGYLIRINQIPTSVDSHYLNLFLNSQIARQHGNSVKTDGVNQSNINGEKLSNYPFPYCSLAEQREIVKLLDEKLSIVDQLEEDTELEIKKADALRQSILRKAFSGKLVAQNPDDEPASVLLKRIKIEKADKENDDKKNGRRKAA